MKEEFQDSWVVKGNCKSILLELYDLTTDSARHILLLLNLQNVLQNSSENVIYVLVGEVICFSCIHVSSRGFIVYTNQHEANIRQVLKAE